MAKAQRQKRLFIKHQGREYKKQGDVLFSALHFFINNNATTNWSGSNLSGFNSRQMQVKNISHRTFELKNNLFESIFGTRYMHTQMLIPRTRLRWVIFNRAEKKLKNNWGVHQRFFKSGLSPSWSDTYSNCVIV